MQGIYTHIPETNHVPREHGVAAILLFLFMVLISLLAVSNLLYFYISTFRSMCAVPNMAVFCSSLTSWFPGMLLTYFLNVFEIVPVAPIITGITFIIIIIIIIIITKIATHTVQLATSRGKDIIQHKFLLVEITHRPAARYTEGAVCPSGTATTGEGREWRWEDLSPTKILRTGHSPWKLRKIMQKS